jgi:hypothetical protein
MALMPIVQRTQVNLPKSEFLAGKNLKKVIAAGEGRAQGIFRNYWTADVGLQRENLKKQGNVDFFYR